MRLAHGERDVDQPALIDALDHGALGFAPLDVTEVEPLTEGHILHSRAQMRQTLHISGNHMLVRHRLLQKAQEDLTCFLRGEKPATSFIPRGAIEGSERLNHLSRPFRQAIRNQA
ncbi:NAD(P)-dependent oxidoreductase [Sphingobium sp.]|uniref:NAD(P)-dependent oxidoreductase n=1 Tax=Sphingobium TaxID=165695 RepID=UPI001A184612|nr:NAD(P)-dependent oxidoreductase [Sphingobium sp.]MBJ7376981.1 hypothetical protein [Sphingobium sp.]